MAKRRHGQESELPFVALMDTMTNVVGVLTIVLVMMGISIASAVRKVLLELPPATEAQISAMQSTLDKTRKEIEAAAKKVATLSNLPNRGNIDAELIRMESQVKDKDIKVFDFDALAKELAARTEEFKKQEAALSAVITERDRLKALLDTTPAAKPEDATIVRIPNSRDLPEDANIYYCFIQGEKIYLVDPVSAKKLVMEQFDREKRNLVKQRIPVPKGIDRMIYDQDKTVKYFATRPMEIRGQKITVPHNKPWTRLALRIEWPADKPDATLADLDGTKGRFHNLIFKLTSLPRAVLMFQVRPDGFATYLKARTIADKYRLACGWDINGNNSLGVGLDFEVNRLEEPPPSQPSTAPPAPKRQLD